MSLKKLKEKLESEENLESKIKICSEIIKKYPKNKYGYVKLLELKTDNYKKYLPREEIEKIKYIYNNAYLYSNKKEKINLKKEYEEYLDDIYETENLKKIKKEIVSNKLTIKINNYIIENVNNNINSLKKYNFKGKRIRNVNDFINGVFYLSFMIFNLIYRNYLLFITIPFGIFGIIVIYSFISSNFINKEKSSEEIVIFKNSIKKLELKNKKFKEENDKKDKIIESNTNLKKESLLRIPTFFEDDIKYLIEDNEDLISTKIIENLLKNNLANFTVMLNEETNLNVDDILNKIKLSKEDKSILEKIFSIRNINKKDNQNKILLVSKLKPYNYFLVCLFLIISIISFVVVLKNISSLNKIAYFISIIIGYITMCIYNINTGKHNSLSDTIKDNLLITIFNTTLIYDLVYNMLNSNLKFTEAFIQIPLIFTLVLIGFVSFVSLLKYKNYIFKLRKE